MFLNILRALDLLGEDLRVITLINERLSWEYGNVLNFFDIPINYLVPFSLEKKISWCKDSNGLAMVEARKGLASLPPETAVIYAVTLETSGSEK